ncbi:MarR family winged helix-turn-helix transcriptional regulator [Nocardia carnea]|uniref:MarR family winged helix-turn-helix transcriptional regulator n=1 Tax=Nocardia carnea TaxID=37328 RepID=UPI00245496D0|nr:MarR family winged helix-turn-helix transcriptional regulator [Nocardia carnea]
MAHSPEVRLLDDLGFLLTRAGGLVVGSVNKALAPLGLKVRPYSVLVLACENAAGVNQRAVAATLGLDPSQVVALVDDLERRGLVERIADHADRRNKLIVATAAGRAVLGEARGLVDEVHSRCFGQLPEQVLDDMREALRGLVAER